MKFVPSDYRSISASDVEMWRHPSEPDGVVTRFGLLASAVLEAVTLELDHAPSCALHLCIYRTNEDACVSLGRKVPSTMLMAPQIGGDWSLFVCQSPNVDPRNGDWERMQRHFAHELAHIGLADLTGGTKTLGDGGRRCRIRPWFDEGFAEIVAATVCKRPDIIERYLAIPASDLWSADKLDAALNAIGSSTREAAFAEAVRRVHTVCQGRPLAEVMRTASAVAPIATESGFPPANFS